jgi:hypothetical protein
MATFTAATFIPQMQPYQPDLNLYANLIQNKQSQYDANWKSLNKMYGQYFYADLTREDNIKKKDYLVDQINFNVNRIAGLDLSLQQNVSQATQIFKPFYEDTGLMKDMAWTKNYNSQVGKYEALQGSSDEKDRAQAWDTGLREMQYKKDDFKNASSDKAMSFQNVLYTPYVNVQNKALDLAKEYGDIQTVTWSPDNRWMIKKTNGEALEEPLAKLFEASLGNDPQVQAIYQTQAYVNRKDYAYSNAAQFGGDKNAAEMKYLENNFTILKDKSVKQYKQIQEQSTVYDNKIKDLQNQIANKTGTPDTQKQLDAYLESKKISDTILERVKKNNDIMSSGESSTTTTSTGFKNPYGDIESLRYKVDNGIASLLMETDLDEAAHTFAFRHYKEDPEANPYAVLKDKHDYSMSEIDARLKGQERLLLIKQSLDIQRDDDNRKLDAGTHIRNEDGEVVPREDLNIVVTEPDSKGELSIDAINLKDESIKISKMTNQEYLTPYLNSTISILGKASTENKIDNKTLSNILATNNGTKLSLKQFNDYYAKYGDVWLRKNYGQEGIQRMQNRMDSWVNTNRGLSIFQDGGKKTETYLNYENSKLKLNDYNLYLKTDEKFRISNSTAVENSLVKDGFKDGKLLYDDKGETLTRIEYQQATLKNQNIKFTDAELNNYNIVQEELRKQNAAGRWGGYQKADWIGPDLSAKGQKARADLGDKYGIMAQRLSRSTMDYDSMLKAARSKWTNPNIVKGSPARLSLGPVDPGTGLFTVGSSKITVNPKGSTSNTAHYVEQMRVLSSLDFGDGKSTLTFDGKGISAYNNARTMDGRNATATAFLNALNVDFNSARGKNSESKLSDFTMSLSPMSSGSQNLTAVTIKPNKAWLDQYVSSSDKTKDNLLSKDEYTAALQNGFTFVSDSKNFSQTSLYRSSYESPLASYVDTFGEYNLTNIGGDPNKSFKISKNKLGLGDYIVGITYPEYDPTTKTTKQKNYSNNTTYFGDELASQRSQMLNWLNEMDELNAYNLNNN